MAKLGLAYLWVDDSIRVSRDQGALANFQRSGFYAALYIAPTQTDPSIVERAGVVEARPDALGLGALLSQGSGDWQQQRAV